MSKAAQLAALIGSGQAQGNRNLIINGGMNVAQRSASVTGIGATSGYFTLDRFKTTFGATSAGRFTMSQSTVADLEGFSNALKVDCTTADTSIAAGELFVIQNPLEGLNLQRLKASSSATKAFTLSFYAKSNASRAIATEFEFTNGTNKQISKLHTIGTSWARYTMTVPAASSTQIDDDNSSELTINFWLHAGSTYTSGTINDDALAPTTSANRAPGIGSLFASTNNTLEITGIQFELGEQATPFEHENFGTTLAKCQRYFHRFQSDTPYDAFAPAYWLVTTQVYSVYEFPVTMRTQPSLAISGTSDWRIHSNGGDGGLGSLVANRSTPNNMQTYSDQSGATGTAGHAGAIRNNNTASAYIEFSAEL